MIDTERNVGGKMFIESLKEKSDQNLFQVLGKTGLWIYAVIYFCHGESDYCPTRTLLLRFGMALAF